MRTCLHVLVVVGCLAGCVTTRLTPTGEKVRVTSNPETVRGCTFLGAVKGADHMNGGIAGQGAAEENANRRLRNAAASMGADTVLIVTATTGMGGSTVRGEGYRCGQR
jgi:hypothetical protein